ncbi:pyruvate dehydrogenase (quinone) [Corynebacterium appendicis CIP 107643]|uniref:Pyruvate dehydrogenase (Quinone) n=1 Tax=Corynebacterium appendicis CIP 107643 TaxID=1161099 RepID=A0A1N7J839_9CORY|nr:pyruvate dehydrogenase [Corynebacterium appendicis]WJY61941.1 Pyruvate dehydrogenase [ubiquinone] [Corynebacterium appendicis CIP 107643]SIS45525.1 pyruvate dehydrogenase (quinone) [Corynebacterium appendicis CIP 107643]
MAEDFAQQIVETLERNGVKRIYGLVGDSLNPVSDAVADSNIEWIHVRNEEAAAFAAGAESLVTGELAVCAASCGPGNTHLIQGLYDSHRNGAKVLAIASHIPSQEIGSKFFQETHPEKIFQECSGYCEMANSPEQGARILHHAIQSTMAGKGVSVFVMPGDIAGQDAADVPLLESTIARGDDKRVFPDAGEAARLVQAINEAETVTLFCGVGAANAREEVLQLAEKIKSPIGHSFGGKMHIQYDNPFDVGMNGLLGYGACYEASHEADLLILLGTDFPYNDWLPDGNVAQVDIKGENIGRRAKIQYPVVGDVKSVIENILPHVEEKKNRKFLDKMLKEHAHLLETVIENYGTKKPEKATPIQPEYAANLIDELADEDAVFTVDTGMCNVWAARYITPNGKKDELASFRHGTMANAVPQAIGAQAADRGRQVITFSGDGGVSMLLGELITVQQHDLPVKMMVFNNSSLGMVKLEMMVAGLKEFQTDHAQVNYANIAEAVGIKSFRVEKPQDLERTIKEAFAYDGPVLVEMVTDPDALSLPPNFDWTMIKGFTESAVKTVLDGGIGNMVELARSNLRNIKGAAAIEF